MAPAAWTLRSRPATRSRPRGEDVSSQILRSHDGPARAGIAHPGPREQALADLLHLPVEPRLVHEGLAMGVDHDAAVDDDGVHAAAVGVVDEIVDGIEHRLPVRALGVTRN